MKRTKQSQTQSLIDALRAFDKASKAHCRDINKRGKAILDVKRLKLLIAQKEARMILDKEFGKWVNV